MIISAARILELNNKYNLIEGLCQRELENPEGVGFDLRVGEVHKLKGKGFLGIEERLTPDTEKIADIESGEERKRIILKPNDYVLVTTIEKITSPAEKITYEEGRKARYLIPFIHPRSTLQRCGVHLCRTKTNPGYSGKLTFGLTNLGSEDFEFELGARMFDIVFHAVSGDLKRSYGGQWQGGRTSTGGAVETQI